MKFEKFIKKFTNDNYIVQNGIVAINDFAIYNVWEINIEEYKLCLYDMNNMLMASIDIDLIKDIDITKRNKEGELYD